MCRGVCRVCKGDVVFWVLAGGQVACLLVTVWCRVVVVFPHHLQHHGPCHQICEVQAKCQREAAPVAIDIYASAVLRSVYVPLPALPALSNVLYTVDPGPFRALLAP